MNLNAVRFDRSSMMMCMCERMHKYRVPQWGAGCR